MAKILVVEDEESLTQFLSVILLEMGYIVTVSHNGEQALLMIEKDPPDLIISDVMMPEMDGYCLLEQIRLNPKWNKTKVVLMSAVYINRDTPYQADEYYRKPFDIDKIQSMIERLLLV